LREALAVRAATEATGLALAPLQGVPRVSRRSQQRQRLGVDLAALAAASTCPPDAPGRPASR
jgi:hypothetical protein